ncbi:nucleoside hydrolase [Rhizobium sp. LjRoot254]|uniref:nucleoside hydrolase n=1 Tax=Rhizobium sp. LjRoot254 TaxID=3342297 RepID=UPI003ECEF258
MHKVIFDTDPGVDDAMALLFLARHPEIDLIGITTAFGNASIETTTRNAQYLKQQWGISAPIAKGAAEQYEPGRATHPFPAYIHGDDGLGNIGIPDVVDVPLDPRPAHQFIIDSIKANPGEIVLVAVGRMTNLANALKAAPEITGLVKEVIIMGGAIDVPGNVTPAAEANIHGDPEAADAVMIAPWKVVVVGLDVTLKTTMTRQTMAALARKGGKDVELLDRLSQFYIDFYKGQVRDSMVVHDTCACVYLVARELFTTRSGVVRVLTTGIGEGMTVQKPDGMTFGTSQWDNLPSQLVCTDVDAAGAMKLVEETLVRQ